MIELWEVAQKYWGKGRKLIPSKVFDIGEFAEAEAVGLVERRDDGYYVSGTAEYLEWYAARCGAASAAGKASADARKKKYGSSVPANATNSDNQSEPKPNDIRTKTERTVRKNRTTSERHPNDIRTKNQPNPNVTLTLTPTLKEENTNTGEYINPEADACGGPTATDPKTSRPAKEKPSEFDFEIADAWHEHALTVAPKKKCNRDREADAVRILRSVDGYSEADIRAVLDFVKRDSFWRTVALSPCGLRITKPGGTRKIDSIVAGMKRGPSGSSSSSKSYQDEQKRTVFDVLDEVGA
jgi:hypothetical protein